MDECTWWHPRQVLNYFSVFNVQGLRPQTVQSSVPYVKDRLVEKHQLFMALTETWLHNHTDGKFILKVTHYSEAIESERRLDAAAAVEV